MSPAASGRSGRKVDSATRGCQATETQQRPKGRNLMESLHSLYSMDSMRSMCMHSMSNMCTRRSLGRTVENKAIQLFKKQSTVTSYVAITVTCCLSIGVPRWLCHTSHNPPSESYSSLILPPNMPAQCRTISLHRALSFPIAARGGEGTPGAILLQQCHWIAERAV